MAKKPDDGLKEESNPKARRMLIAIGSRRFILRGTNNELVDMLRKNYQPRDLISIKAALESEAGLLEGIVKIVADAYNQKGSPVSEDLGGSQPYVLVLEPKGYIADELELYKRSIKLVDRARNHPDSD